MENCIFCKIVKNEIPCAQIYEDENFLAFLDIQPVLDGHMLIIPKAHVVWMQDMADEATGEIFKLAKKLMIALKTGMNCDFVQVSVVGTEVPHFHVHLIPRYFNDGLPKFITKEFNKEEAGKIIEKISKNIK
jgi:histidine triad (HIT) family protein